MSSTAAAAASAESVASEAKIDPKAPFLNLIFDTDMGCDDAVALAVALLHSERVKVRVV